MNALNCITEAFAWLFRPGIRRFILLPLAVNIVLFAAGSYAAFHCVCKRKLAAPSPAAIIAAFHTNPEQP